MKSVCKVYKNGTPAQFTGNSLRWICETPSGIIYCETRGCARVVARQYNEERRRLLFEHLKEQGKQEFYN